MQGTAIVTVHSKWYKYSTSPRFIVFKIENQKRTPKSCPNYVFKRPSPKQGTLKPRRDCDHSVINRPREFLECPGLVWPFARFYNRPATNAKNPPRYLRDHGDLSRKRNPPVREIAISPSLDGNASQRPWPCPNKTRPWRPIDATTSRCNCNGGTGSGLVLTCSLFRLHRVRFASNRILAPWDRVTCPRSLRHDPFFLWLYCSLYVKLRIP